jgi:hypothetical protein
MLISSASQRLSWHPTLAFRFESIWSLTRKICRVNYLPLKDFVKLVKKGSVVNTVTFRENMFSNSDWIDNRKFSFLLSDLSENFEHSFLHQCWKVGVDIPQYAVRHCPACLALDYHCTLFDLTILKTCPWHGLPLLKPCLRCAQILWDSSSSLASLHLCSHQDVYTVDFLDKLQTRFDTKERFDNEISVHCEEIINWSLRLSKEHNYLHLVPHIGHAGIKTERTDRQLNVETSTAVKLAGKPNFVLSTQNYLITINLFSMPVQSANTCLKGSVDKEVCTGILKSTRRHLFKKYIKKHRKCLNFLMALSKEKQPPLTTNVCTVALAYLVWRMALLGISNVEGLKFNKKFKYWNKVEGGSGFLPIDFESYSRALYLRFFNIWYEIEHRASTQNFDINLSDSFIWESDTSIAIAVKNGPTDSKCEGSFIMPCPDGLELARKAAARCERRKMLNADMCWLKYDIRPKNYFLNQSKDWGKQQRRMFQVRIDFPLSNGTVREIMFV